MKKNFFWRILLIAATTLLSIIYFLPSTPVFSSMPEWWKKYMPDKGMILGLDLQGGVHLVFEVEGDKAVDITLERIAAHLRNILEEKGLKTEIKKENSDIIIKPSSDEIKKIVKDENAALTLAEESKERLLYRLTNKEINTIKDTSIDQALETIRNRIDQFGVAEPTIQKQGANEIVIQLPGVKDTQRAIDLIGKTAILEFKILDDENPIAAKIPAIIAPNDEEKILQEFWSQIPPDDEILFGRDTDKETGNVIKRAYLMKKQTLLTGDLLTEAKVDIDQLYRKAH